MLHKKETPLSLEMRGFMIYKPPSLYAFLGLRNRCYYESMDSLPMCTYFSRLSTIIFPPLYINSIRALMAFRSCVFEFFAPLAVDNFGDFLFLGHRLFLCFSDGPGVNTIGNLPSGFIPFLSDIGKTDFRIGPKGKFSFLG
jgi:hypothetical protein